ncbi:hypothetical protein SVAN01_04673 [Stagonosporopsis vannaccii]|nr:hypothetical protein SVAN01_04673 [Stagonosporopsis vannaccii]
MFADSEMTHVCCATAFMVYQDGACSTKRPRVSQRLVEGMIDSYNSKSSEQKMPQLKGRVRETVQDKKERHVRQASGEKERWWGGMEGFLNEIAGLTSRTLPCTSSGRGKSDSRTVEAGRGEDVLRTGAVEAAHLCSEGEVSAEALALEPVQMRQGGGGVSCCPSMLVTPCTKV